MKVEIITKKGNYNKSVKGGKEYMGVSYFGKSYGGGSPCDNPKEVEEAIKHAIKVIKSNGDIPIVNKTKQTQLFTGNYT
jgi:hypothetical protein